MRFKEVKGVIGEVIDRDGFSRLAATNEPPINHHPELTRSAVVSVNAHIYVDAGCHSSSDTNHNNYSRYCSVFMSICYSCK